MKEIYKDIIKSPETPKSQEFIKKLRIELVKDETLFKPRSKNGFYHLLQVLYDICASIYHGDYTFTKARGGSFTLQKNTVNVEFKDKVKNEGKSWVEKVEESKTSSGNQKATGL